MDGQTSRQQRAGELAWEGEVVIEGTPEADGRPVMRNLPVEPGLESTMGAIMDDIRDQLPNGMDFGLFLLVPESKDGQTGIKVVAGCTDRRLVALGVAHWVVSDMDPLGVADDIPTKEDPDAG